MVRDGEVLTRREALEATGVDPGATFGAISKEAFDAVAITPIGKPTSRAVRMREAADAGAAAAGDSSGDAASTHPVDEGEASAAAVTATAAAVTAAGDSVVQVSPQARDTAAPRAEGSFSASRGRIEVRFEV